MKTLLRYIPISLFVSLVVFDFLQIYYFTNDACACVVNYKSIFLGNEILNLGFISFMYLAVKRSKLCYYNIVATIGLFIITLLNIIAITTKFDYTFYNSLVTQILITILCIMSIYLLNREIYVQFRRRN